MSAVIYQLPAAGLTVAVVAALQQRVPTPSGRHLLQADAAEVLFAVGTVYGGVVVAVGVVLAVPAFSA